MPDYPGYDAARTFLVDIDYFSGSERYATDILAIDADTPLAARRRAMELAAASNYADDRIPDQRRVVHMADLADGTIRHADLLALLAQASDALSCCLDDLDSWASAGPESYSADERQRRDRYGMILERIDAAL